MEDFISKIEVRYKNKKIKQFDNLNFLTIHRKYENLKESKKEFLKPGMEIWQIQYFTKIDKIKELKLCTILKPKYYLLKNVK